MRKLFQTAFLTGLILTILSLPCLALPVGSKAPDFELKNIEGQTVRLSDYRGRFVLLKLGSTRCPTCQEQVDSITKLGEYLEKKDVVFLDVFLRDNKKSIVETVGDEDYPKTAEILVGDLDVHRAYRVYLIPRVLLIDPEGKIVRDGSLWTAYDIKRRIEKVSPDKKGGEKTNSK